MLSAKRVVWHGFARAKWAFFSVLLGFGGAWVLSACVGEIGPAGSSDSACPAASVDPPVQDTPTACTESMPEPCMRYRIQLMGNPNMDPALRAKYKAAFGSACYMSEGDTFDCFYQDPQKACADGVLVPEVFGAAPYEKNYTCEKVKGTEDYTRQVGPDPALKIDIKLENAPRQSPLIDIKGVSTAVNGPYRNLAEPQNVGPGGDFYCNTIDKNGATIKQKDLILQVNRDAHGGQIYSDLAGFTWPCLDESCKPKTCTEPLVLKVGPKDDPEAAQVHHVVRRMDERGCPWGTNSNRNAAVISRKLNRYLWYKYPSANEVVRINQVPAYAP